MVCAAVLRSNLSSCCPSCLPSLRSSLEELEWGSGHGSTGGENRDRYQEETAALQCLAASARRVLQSLLSTPVVVCRGVLPKDHTASEASSAATAVLRKVIECAESGDIWSRDETALYVSGSCEEYSVRVSDPATAGKHHSVQPSANLQFEALC